MCCDSLKSSQQQTESLRIGSKILLCLKKLFVALKHCQHNHQIKLISSIFPDISDNFVSAYVVVALGAAEVSLKYYNERIEVFLRLSMLASLLLF